MISLLLEFVESLRASIKRHRAERAAADAVKTAELVNAGKTATADIDAEIAKMRP